MGGHDKSILVEGLRAMAHPLVCPWDDYYARMAQTDFLEGRHMWRCSKTYFIRESPFEGSYAILGGVTEFLRQVHDYRFTDETIGVMRSTGYQPKFLKHLLERKRLSLTVHSLPEGSMFFPGEPAVVLEGPLADVRLAEGMLLPCVNYPSLAMAKWSRVAYATGTGSVMEFARRRAQDPCRTSLYAYLAGAAVSSNDEMRQWFDIPTVGTMGHEWIQSYGDEYAAFDAWLRHNPDRPVLLVDTIDTLSSGVPNAIKALKAHREAIGDHQMGIRLDSGDLAYLAMRAYQKLDMAGLFKVKIYMTNDLDEYSIQAIRNQIEQNAAHYGYSPGEIFRKLVWACGTKPGTCWNQPSIGGVAKLTTVMLKALEQPVIKLARDNPIKTSIPGSNRSATLIDEHGMLQGIVVFGRKEDPQEIREFIHPDDGSKRTTIPHDWEVRYRQSSRKDVGPPSETLTEVRERVHEQLAMLHWTHRRLNKPHRVKVGLSPELFDLRQSMIKRGALSA